jgi:carbonic anhydrase
MFTKAYSNQVDANSKFNGHTSQVNLDAANGSSMFTSKIAEQIFGADNEFSASQFHFHSGSEHTIDNKRFDLEMHTVHFPKDVENDFIAAAVGILFSVEEYTANLSWSEQALINTFFDSLKWSDMSDDGPTVDLVTYGNLMQMVDTNNRYIYKGSVTTPPCATFVYWNVLSTVYPISLRHVTLFKK